MILFQILFESFLSEPIELSLTLENTIKPNILFEDINILWSFCKDDKTIIENKHIFTYHEINEDARVYYDSIVSSSTIKSIQLNGQDKKTIVFKLTPKMQGNLIITGLVGRISALNDNLTLLGKIIFPKTFSKNEKASSGDLNQNDKIFDIVILPPAPALHVNFSCTPSNVLAGEIIPVQVYLTNTGVNALTNIYMATDEPRWIIINPEENELPLSILKGELL